MIKLNPSRKKEIDQIVEDFLSLLISKDVIYISGAITTGKDFLNWYMTQGKQLEDKAEYKKEHYKRVITKNLDIILKFTENRRSKVTNRVIIEPASFDVVGWSQVDYLYYWGQIITKCVKTIIFLDGWNYSNGCIYEYSIGLMNDVELVDQNYQPLNRTMAISLIEDSIKDYEDNDINVDFQKKVLSGIKNGNKNN